MLLISKHVTFNVSFNFRFSFKRFLSKLNWICFFSKSLLHVCAASKWGKNDNILGPVFLTKLTIKDIVSWGNVVVMMKLPSSLPPCVFSACMFFLNFRYNHVQQWKLQKLYLPSVLWSTCHPLYGWQPRWTNHITMNNLIFYL